MAGPLKRERWLGLPKNDKENHSKIRKAVFPAAGLGTRFLPATKAQPKEMLPLVDKPIIQYVIEEAVASGLRNIIIVTGRGKNAIEDHFDVSYELEKTLEERGKKELADQVRSISELIHVSYVRQKEALGLGHAILMTRELIGDEPFAVFLGDDIIESQPACMRQMMDVYDRYHGAVVALEEVPNEEISRYGVIEGKPVGQDALGRRVFEIKNMVEKPSREQAPSNLAIIGRYILTPEIFDCLEQTRAGAGGEIQLTDGLKALLGRQPIYGYQFEGKRHDAGDKLGFLKATVEFALKRDDLGGPFREYLKSLKL
jgi:UTP--glucose-1-phosphate uridylyltransferase